jgi:mono/diheme cytochrome c family protein
MIRRTILKPKGRSVGTLVLFLIWSLGMAPMPKEIEEFGKNLYEQHCLGCHGTRDLEDGPESKSLTIKPANFHSPESRIKTDGEILSKVVWGGMYSPMHGWGTRISRKEIHSVIRYIRFLAPYQRESN